MQNFFMNFYVCFMTSLEVDAVTKLFHAAGSECKGSEDREAARPSVGAARGCARCPEAFEFGG